MEYRKRRGAHRGIFAGLFLLLLGSVLMLQNFYPLYHIEGFIWPGIIVFIGLALLLRRRRYDWHDEWHDHFHRHGRRWRHGFGHGAQPFEKTGARASEDFIDTVSGFGTVKRKVVSKSFQGGDITTIMGHTIIDLTEADFNGTARMDVTQIMGATKIIVPPDWEVRSDVSAVFAGFEDKRERPMVNNPEKVLQIDGTSVMGGIEVRTA